MLANAFNSFSLLGRNADLYYYRRFDSLRKSRFQNQALSVVDYFGQAVKIPTCRSHGVGASRRVIRLIVGSRRVTKTPNAVDRGDSKWRQSVMVSSALSPRKSTPPNPAEYMPSSAARRRTPRTILILPPNMTPAGFLRAGWRLHHLILGLY